MFIYLSHPLSLRLILLVQSIFFGIFIYLFRFNRWLSYILIIVFIRGILIIFIYVSCLASNEKIIINFIGIIFFSLILKFNVIEKIENNNFFFFDYIFFHFYKMYSEYSYILSFFFIFFLLILLILVTKLTSSIKGPIQIKL